MKKKILLLILSIVTVLTILGSSTYSLLFKENETEIQSYTTGILEITSESINDSVTLTDSLPMEDADSNNLTPYSFRITNTGNLTYQFDVKLLSTTTSNQINSQYIKLRAVSKDVDTSCVTLSSLTDGLILEDIVLTPGESYDVYLRVWLDYNTPNTEIGKVFTGKVTTEGQAIPMTQGEMTLTMLGIEDSVQTNTPNFSNTSCSSGCEEATVGIYEAEDDLGMSYYFRGDVENNYVYFAGFYWRIIRINGDGTIRMIYDGASAHANGESSIDRQIDTYVFNDMEESEDNIGVGYMYGIIGGSNYDETTENVNNSGIKNYLDNWYNTNLNSYSNYIVDAIYCNDRSIVNGTGIGATLTYYGAYQRLYINKTPTLMCVNKNDRFTLNDSLNYVIMNNEVNKNLTYPIGLVTADEASLSGMILSSNNSLSYLYNGNDYWTMTPESFEDGSFSYFISSAGSISSDYVYYESAVRPVISLKANAIKSGTGTMTDPYLIYLKGDVDRDGVLTSDDANLIQLYDVGLIELDSEQLLLGDCGIDGFVDILDSSIIVQIANGIVSACFDVE